MVQWVKNPALSLQQLRLLLWPGFDPLPRKKRKEKELKKSIQTDICIGMFLATLSQQPKVGNNLMCFIRWVDK